MEFKKTIGIFENAFSKKECKELIARQEYAIKNGLASEGGYGTLVGHKKSMDFDLISSNHPKDQKFVELIADRFNDYNLNYLADFAPYGEYHAESLILDQTYYPVFQIQKYKKKEGHFNSFHLEEYGQATSERVFVFILYLNDVKEGGETAFYFKEDGEEDYFKVKPKAGTLIIHPASWPYVHKGCMPESSDKYILTTWCCYGN
jgi:hypothetical protein